MRKFWKSLTNDGQLRWIGPDKGAIHLATAAIINAIWDLYAKMNGKPLWKLLSDMTPEEIVSCIDFHHITDALTPDEALQILRRNSDTKQNRIVELSKTGMPTYTSSAGWLGYSEEKVRALCKKYKG